MGFSMGPLSLGEILDHAVRLLQARAVPLIKMGLVTCFPLLLIQETAAWYFNQLAAEPPENVQVGVIAATIGLVAVVLVSQIFVMPLIQGTFIAMTAAFYRGEELSGRPALRDASRRYAALLWTRILAAIILFFAYLALIVPGVILTYRYWVSTQVVMLEGLSGLAALRRSSQLMKSRMLQGFVLSMVLAVLYMFIVGSAAMVVIPVLSQAANAFMSLIGVILGVTVGVVFYYALLCRHEGFDLARRLDAMATRDEAASAIPAAIPLAPEARA
ncbi:MAG: hypothetical protein H6683_06770 [Deltaproteobacteria bacterium]|nr:hypothetical protein [Deltaproteobacteria bacterium]